jgi:hypothetical protein
MANPKQGKLLHLKVIKYTKEVWLPTPTVSIHSYKAEYYPAWGPQKYETLVALDLETTEDKIAVIFQEWPRLPLQQDDDLKWLPGAEFKAW